MAVAAVAFASAAGRDGRAGGADAPEAVAVAGCCDDMADCCAIVGGGAETGPADRGGAEGAAAAATS